MDFTHDTSVTLRTAAALVNSAPGRGNGSEDLPTAAAATRFFEGWNWSHTRCTPQDLASLHELRTRLRALWELPVARLAAEVNALLAEGEALPRLVEHGQGYGWHIHGTPDGAPLARAASVEVAFALVDLVRAGASDRLKVCAAEDCDDVLVDLSKNRSRKYCDGTCGTRAHVAAYRERRAHPSSR